MSAGALAMSRSREAIDAATMSNVPSSDRLEDEPCDNRNDQYLSNHTISMRAALNHCRELLPSCSPLDSSKLIRPALHDVALDAWNAAQTIPQNREKAREELSRDLNIPFVQFTDLVSALDFRTRFHHSNRPCLIRGLDGSEHFVQVTSQWRTDKYQINKEWFGEHVGDDTLVPVRRQQASFESCLDDEGRAEECVTVEMTLREWRHGTATCSPDLYLKDWHFQKWWETKHPSEAPLYTVPVLFQHDLLNEFLLKCTEGDYRFVYWGPPGSQTPPHSDVLHSLSWSYNVVGEKKWTFTVPSTSSEIVLHQRAGETVFVPSGWTHTVQNVCETLSINHNWITTATIDRTWDCIWTEMQAVDTELSKWNDEEAPWDSKEFMLRGCVGLDVTAFFFMVVTAQLDLLNQELDDESDECWERFFSMFRLHQLLETLTGPEVHLGDRLASVLAQKRLASEAMNVVNISMELMKTVIATLQEVIS